MDLGLIFLAGLLASMHCVGMCGPIVLAYSTMGASGAAAPGMLKLHLAYNAGRVLSYGALGAVLGLTGTMLGSLKIAAEVISIVGGVLMIVFGIGMFRFSNLKMSTGSGRISAAIRKLYGPLFRKSTLTSKLSLGLLTPLLPCGILYAMLVKAITAGTAVAGALTMSVYALGMAPALIMVGSLSSVLSGRMRKNAENIAAVIVILMGITLILRGLHVPYVHWLMGGGQGGHMH